MAWNCVLNTPRRRRRQRESHEAQFHNAMHCRFCRLPGELLNMIYQHLPFDASVALILTCAGFYHSSILAPVRQNLKSTKAAHFEGMCMLEDDGIAKGYRCQGCQKRHSSALFSQQELEKRATQRFCLWTQKCLSLASPPAKCFADIKRLAKKTTEKNLRQYGLLAARLGTRILSPIERYRSWIILYPTRELISKEQFTGLCRRLNFVLCPHTLLGDAKVTELFPLELNKSHTCQYCRTKITLGRYKAFNNWEWCAIVTWRDLGNLFSPLEPTWLAQAFASRDECWEAKRQAASKWRDDFWTRSFKDMRELECFEQDNDCLPFQSIALPDTFRSRMARKRVHVFLVARRVIPEHVHRKFRFPDGTKK